jgi:hypothetical protein
MAQSQRGEEYVNCTYDFNPAGLLIQLMVCLIGLLTVLFLLYKLGDSCSVTKEILRRPRLTLINIVQKHW